MYCNYGNEEKTTRILIIRMTLCPNNWYNKNTILRYDVFSTLVYIIICFYKYEYYS